MFVFLAHNEIRVRKELGEGVSAYVAVLMYFVRVFVNIVFSNDVVIFILDKRKERKVFFFLFSANDSSTKRTKGFPGVSRF